MSGRAPLALPSPVIDGGVSSSSSGWSCAVLVADGDGESVPVAAVSAGVAVGVAVEVGEAIEVGGAVVPVDYGSKVVGGALVTGVPVDPGGAVGVVTGRELGVGGGGVGGGRVGVGGCVGVAPVIVTVMEHVPSSPTLGADQLISMNV